MYPKIPICEAAANNPVNGFADGFNEEYITFFCAPAPNFWKSSFVAGVIQEAIYNPPPNKIPDHPKARIIFPLNTGTIQAIKNTNCDKSPKGITRLPGNTTAKITMTGINSKADEITDGFPTINAVSIPTVISRSGKRFTNFLRAALDNGTNPSIMIDVIFGNRSMTAAKYIPN